jgi:hypothetical protein
VGFVLNNDGAAVLPANRHRKAATEGATYERFNNVLIIEGRVTKRQRQNSSVRTRRETNPARWLDFFEDVETVSGAEVDGATIG